MHQLNDCNVVEPSQNLSGSRPMNCCQANMRHKHVSGEVSIKGDTAEAGAWLCPLSEAGRITVL